MLRAEELDQDCIERTLGAYEFVRMFRASGKLVARSPFPGEHGERITLEAAEARLVDSLHWVIAQRGGGMPTTRKWSSEYQVGLVRDCHRLRDRARIRLRVLLEDLETPELRRRYQGELESRLGRLNLVDF